MKILYFTSDFSAENIEFAKKYGMTMRNAAAVETAQNLEQCDMVYGDETPENYRKAFELFVLSENNATQGVSQEAYNVIVAENEQLKAENEELKMRHAEFAESTAQTVAIEAYQALQAELETAQARIAELEAELTAAKTTKGKKTTPAE